MNRRNILMLTLIAALLPTEMNAAGQETQVRAAGSVSTPATEDLEQFALVYGAFANHYKPITRVYPLDGLTPGTVDALVQPTMQSAMLVASPTADGKLDYKFLEGRSISSNMRGMQVRSEYRDTYEIDRESGVMIVTALKETQAKVEDVLSMAREMVKESSSAGSVRQYPLDLLLLRSVTGDEARREVKVYMPMEGLVLENQIVVGRMVKTGEALMKVRDQRAERQREEVIRRLKLTESELANRQEHLARINEGSAIQGVERDTLQLQLREQIFEMESLMAKHRAEADGLEKSIGWQSVEAPMDGEIVNVGIDPGIIRKVAAGEWIATIAPTTVAEAGRILAMTPMVRGSEQSVGPLRLRVIRVEANDVADQGDDTVEISVNSGTDITRVTIGEFESQFMGEYEIAAEQIEPAGSPGDGSVRLTVREVGSAPATVPPQVLAEFGLTPADLGSIGIGSFAVVSRTAVSLNNLEGENGNALVTLGDDYRCRLAYVDERPPYVIVRAALLPVDKNVQPLIENTLFLDGDKPAVLGLTNMRDALVLVARHRKEP
jgi:multidrug efflux pump subunit AcrA (membrane-fusion protein)